MPQAWEPATAANSVFHTPQSDDAPKLVETGTPPNAHADTKTATSTVTEGKTTASPRPFTPSQHKADESNISTIQQQSPKSIASTVQRPNGRARARSTSSKLIHRLTSRGSQHSISQYDNPATSAASAGSPGSDASSMDLPGKIDKEALSRARGKYKSGVNLESGLMLNLADEDAFMQSSTLEDPAPETVSANDAARNDLLASGGTAAAKAYYQGHGTGYGSTIFPEQQIAAAEASRAAAFTAQQQESLRRQLQQPRSPPSAAAKNPTLLAANGHLRKSGPAQRGSTSSTSVLSSGSSSLSPHPERSSLGAAFDTKSRDSSPATKSAQPANKSANGATLSAGETTTDKAPSSDGGHSNENSQSADKSPAASIKSKRRTFLGLSSKSTDKVDKIPGGKKSRRASTVSVNTETQDGDTADGSVRRRRYPNTRELDILAAQLAREAAIEQHMPQLAQSGSQWGSASPSGSRTPADRRSPGSLPSTQSLASMPSAFQPFAQPFARNDSPASSAGPSSPRFNGGAELPGPTHFVRAGLTKSPSASPSVTQKANISGMPGDMLTGLGHGPYPFVAQDPLASSGDQNGSSSVSGDATPNHGRRGSAPGSKKTSVLSMTMHDPETEMQGLTKMPKSGKGTPRGTPWGSRVPSRAPSRAVSPRSSNTNLREAAGSPKQQQGQGQQMLNQLPTSGGSHINLAGLTGLRRRSQGSSSEERGKVSVDGSGMSSGATGVVVPTPVAEHPASAVQTPAVEAQRSVDGPSTASSVVPSGVQTGSTTPRAAPSGKQPAPSPSPVSPTSQTTLSPARADQQQNGTAGSQDKRKARLSFFGAFGKSRENVSLSKQEKKEQNKRRSLPSSPAQSTKGLPTQGGGMRGMRRSAEQASPAQGLSRTKSPARPPRSASRPGAPAAPTSADATSAGAARDVPPPLPSSPPSSKRPGFKRFLSKFGSSNNVHSPKKSPTPTAAPPLPANAATAKDRAAVHQSGVAPSTPPRLTPSRADHSDLSSSSRDSRGQQSSSTSISTQATTPSVSGASTGGDGGAADWVLMPEDVDVDKQQFGKAGAKGETSVTVMGPALTVAGR